MKKPFFLPLRPLVTLSLPEGRIRIVLTAREAFKKVADDLCGVSIARSYLGDRNPVQVLPCQ